jgi:hypothetical protein
MMTSLSELSVQFANTGKFLSCDWQWKLRLIALKNPLINVKSRARLASKRTFVSLNKVNRFGPKAVCFGVKSMYTARCIFGAL